MYAFSASRLLVAGLVAAIAAAPMPAVAESLEITHPGMLKPPAPNAAPVAPSGWDPVKKEAITGKPKPGAQAQTDLEFLRQRAARLGSARKADITSKRGIVGGTRKPDRGQVAMETLVLQHEGLKAPKAPQGAALDDLPGSPPAPGAIAPAPRAPSRAFNPTELSVTKTVPWKQQRRSRAAATPQAIATK